MTVLVDKVNADPLLAAMPIDNGEPLVVSAGMPVLATPATIVAAAAGVAMVAGVAGAFAAGYAIGHGMGTPSPHPVPK
jgi:hypothetical protein